MPGAVGPDSATTTLVVSQLLLLICRADEKEEMPEPIKNAFEDANAPPEEKTVAPVGPANEIQFNPSTQAVPLREPIEKIEDLRNPVGMDAGAPEVTDAAADEGGWHGGAEDNEKREREAVEAVVAEGRPREEPAVEEIKVERIAVDDEARRLAKAAMEADARE